MQAKLVIIAGSTKPQEIKLRLPAVLGRGRACSIQLPQPLISRQHCEIYADGEALRVRDLGSLNGTLVNNERITETELTDGMLLTIGSITFRVEIEEELPDAPLIGPSASSLRNPATVKGSAVATAPQPAVQPQPAAAPTAAAPAAGAPASPSTPGTASPAADSQLPPTERQVDLPQRVGDLIGAKESSDFTVRAIAPLRPTAESPPSGAEETRAQSEDEPSIHADELLPPAAGDSPTGAPIAASPPLPPMAVPVAMPGAAPLAAPLATPFPPAALPPTAVPPAVPAAPADASAADSASGQPGSDEDLQAFLKSLGSKKKK